MRKLGALMIALALPFVLATSGCTGTKVGLVNPNRLFQESASGKAGIEHLKQMEGTLQEQLTAAQKLIEKKPGDENLRMQVQQEFASYQQLATNEQRKVVESINTQVKSTLEAVRIQKKLDAIFTSENALSFDDKIDVTNEVLTEMDRKPLTFSPVEIVPIEQALNNAKKPASK